MLKTLASQLLTEAGALLENSHFVLKAGDHSDQYVNKDTVYTKTRIFHQLCDMIVEVSTAFTHIMPEVILGPEKGAIHIARRVADVMTTQIVEHGIRGPKCGEVKAAFAEKSADGESFVLKRGYDKLVNGRGVLIVEDILTTGSSVAATVAAVRKAGGDIIGVVALVNRGNVTAEKIGVGVLYSLVNLDIKSWPEEDCPLCEENVPINTEVGKGAEYLERKRLED